MNGRLDEAVAMCCIYEMVALWQLCHAQVKLDIQLKGFDITLEGKVLT